MAEQKLYSIRIKRTYYDEIKSVGVDEEDAKAFVRYFVNDPDMCRGRSILYSDLEGCEILSVTEIKTH